MSKKNESNKKINKITKVKKRRRNINNKKSVNIISFIKDTHISKKFIPLKTKKNQLRCHYCKLPMLRSNYARHLKTHLKSFNSSNKIKKETKKNKSYVKQISCSNSPISKSSSSISELSKSEESDNNSESKSENKIQENFDDRHLKTHLKSFNSSNKIKKETKKNKSYVKQISCSNSPISKSSSSISELSKSEESDNNSESKCENKIQENFDDYYFTNELRNTDDNKFELEIKFGNIDFNGTIIYKFPNSTKYTVYAFKKSSYFWKYSKTKYDIPQLYINRPRNFSFFSSISDIKMIKKFYETYHDKIILQEFKKVQKKNIQGIKVYINIDLISEWKVIYKNINLNLENGDDILVELYFPLDFPFERPMINIEYYTYGLKFRFLNCDEYMMFMNFWKPYYNIEELIIKIKNILDNLRGCYKPKNINDKMKNEYYEKIKLINENKNYVTKIDEPDFNINYELLEINENNEKAKREDIFEVIPLKKYCELCKLNYIEYKLHIESRFHRKNLRKIKFDMIKETFKRIINDHNNKNKYKIKINLNEK